MWGQSGTSVKDQDPCDLVSEYGTQRDYYKAKVHRDRKGSNPSTILFYSFLR